jgi:glycine dehydrogenase subunit 2
VNLHKTFSTPHGGGGPGAGPVGVRGDLVKFLPVPRIVKNGDLFGLDEDLPETIGHLAPFCGQFLVCLRACAYILSLGREGLMKVSENAVLNANYLMHGLRDAYDLPYNRRCMHEFVVSASRQKDRGVSALDIAKALIDEGFHPPTVYFPLIVREALMIETAETESKETLDRFVAAMLAIADRAAKTPESFANLPVTATVSRPDETRAAREMDIVFKP